MNKIDLADGVAIVTGGAQGIGYAVAERFSQSGARVAIWDIDAGLAKEAAEKVQGSAGIEVDVTNPNTVMDAVALTERTLGPVTILVHCAGVAGKNTTVAEYPVEEWRRVMEINLNGTFYVNRAVIQGMIQRKYGRIVNVASIAGKEGNPNASAYSASKAGVIALTKSLGKELAGLNIAVNCITPAAARTRIFDQMTQQHIDYMLSKIPRNRFVEVTEIASMVAWLCSRENSFTTGAAFDLSGGRATY
ncbi:MAG: SDR family NAD(P)-dependent oxidoreductase [Parvibaculaceae bacterium]